MPSATTHRKVVVHLPHVGRFIRIEEHISKLKEVDTIRCGDVRQMRDIMKSIADFESVMTNIQGEGVHIGEVHDSFQLRLPDQSELKDYIDGDTDITCDITCNATFEKVVFRILNGQPGSLTDEGIFLLVNEFLAESKAIADQTRLVDNKRTTRRIKKDSSSGTLKAVDIRFQALKHA
ncbi:hypothetical protein BBJ28_00005526 [Nothophytophthora sp. Chile5]|nr:hypothetical protein BBJ28_00005526 [Nothophytophthora sp. Chile5]